MSPGPILIRNNYIAAGSISGGVVLQRNAAAISRRPGLLLGASGLITGLAQLGLERHYARQKAFEPVPA